MTATTFSATTSNASATARLIAAEERGGARLTAAALVTPATLLIAVGLLIPLLILFRYSLNQFIDQRKLMVEAVTLANYAKFFTDAYYVGILVRTLRVAITVTAICLLLGFPLAYVLARTQTRFKNLLIMLVVLPLFVGNAVRAAGWMTLFGSKGAINATLMALGVISTPLEIMYTETAV
ncbi:MAG: ABC transporter permease, partial [Alphaproteobacteria bacterium]|nr:ABC transporter permease [Alphaproteobacteria bacterium]